MLIIFFSRPTSSRWRTRGESKHLKRKASRSSGLPFTDEKGRQRDGKALKPVGNHTHGENSKYKCESFSEDERKSIFNEYWKLGENYKAKKNLLLQFTKKHEVFRRRSHNEQEDPKRNVSYSYFLLKDNVAVPVCKTFFCATFGISYKPIEKAHSNRLSATNTFAGEDGRGKQPTANKLPDDVLAGIKKHIESFPVVESHYCRKESSRKYLDCKLNITKMHELYLQTITEQPKAKISYQMYQKIFCTDYNMSFYKPRKDTCGQCSVYETLAPEDPKKIELEEGYKAHLARKESARNSMKADIEAAKSDPELVVATVDLQSVLQIPTSSESLFYYKRKLCVYNLTIYVENEKKGIQFG